MQLKALSILSLHHHKACSHVLTPAREFKCTNKIAKGWGVKPPAMPLKSNYTLNILLGFELTCMVYMQ